MNAFKIEQKSIDQMEAEGRKRNVNYVNSKSDKGTFSPEISAEVACRIREFCAERNLNKTRFVEEACTEKINRELRKELENMDEEQKTELLSQLLGIGS